MTTTPPIIDQAEQLVRDLADQLTRVREGECLCCYVGRQLDEIGCNGTHQHSIRFRDAVAPRATALRKTLSRMGACCCDCEVLTNAYGLAQRFWTPAREVVDDEGFTCYIEAGEPVALPPCARVRRGTVQPCDNWQPVRRAWR